MNQKVRMFFGLAGTLCMALLGNSLVARASTVYFNDFNSGSASLSGLTITTPAYNFGSYSATVESGQFRIATFTPNPTAAFAAVNNSTFGSPYSNRLKANPGTVTWAFNVSNLDGAFNGYFFFSLASSAVDSQVFTSSAYTFGGGGYVGNQMNFYRNGGPSTILLNVPSTNGLPPLPSKGSFRITYEPRTDLWSVFGFVGLNYVDPTTVTNLMGSVVDSTFTDVPLPFMAWGGGGTGTVFFDNVSVSVVVPEPSVALLLLCGILAHGAGQRLRARRDSDSS